MMKILSTAPATADINVSLEAEIKITFSEQIDPLSIDDSSISLSTNKTSIVYGNTNKTSIDNTYSDVDFFSDELSGVISGKARVSGNDLYYKPNSMLKTNAIYVVHVS